MQVVPQPFCKVCKDSDKSEAMYTSHWVKDKQGKVCCPTLLSQQCRYCNNHGHTIKFCKIAAQDNMKVVITKAPEVKLVNKPQNSLMSNNRWSALAALAEVAQAPAQAEAEEYPSLSPNVTLRPHQKHFATLSFAAVAAIPQAAPQVVPQVVPKSAPVKFSRNWADDDSSDDDEEEEPQYDCASGYNSSITSEDEQDDNYMINYNEDHNVENAYYYRQQVASF